MSDELYGLIVKEAFRHTLLPVFDEITGDAMRIFGGYDMQQAAMYALSGGLLAVIVLYGLGRVLLPVFASRMGERYAELRDDLKWVLPFGALTVMSPVGFMVVIALGIFRVSPWLVVSLAAVTLLFGYHTAWTGI